MAEDFVGWTPYHYVHNNPINLIDPTGMEAEGWGKKGNTWEYDTEITADNYKDKGYDKYMESGTVFSQTNGVADGEYSYSLNANGSVNDINGNSVESSFTTKYGTNINVGGGSVFARILSDVGGGSQVLATHNEALAGSTNSIGSTNWAAYAAHTIWLDKINNYGGDMGSAATPTQTRTPRSIRWEGKTFSQYKTSYWATRTKTTYQPIRMSDGKVFNVYTELHHRFIPQRAKWAPNWLKNNRLNLQPLNTIQHGISDPYRFQFFPKEIKQAINNGNTFGY